MLDRRMLPLPIMQPESLFKCKMNRNSTMMMKHQFYENLTMNDFKINIYNEFINIYSNYV